MVANANNPAIAEPQEPGYVPPVEPIYNDPVTPGTPTGVEGPPPPDYQTGDEYEYRDPYYDESGLQTGVGGNLNERINLGLDPKMLDANGQIMANNPYATKDYNTQYGRADATNRGVGQNELSAVQLEKMLASNSPLMQRAASQAMARGGSRGLMNSSITQGAAQGAMIDRAQPFALQDANRYGQTSSENMAATNQASLTNAQMRTQAGLADTQAGSARDQLMLQGDWNARGQTLKHMLGMETREDQQRFQTQQDELNRIWTSGENAENRTADWAKSYLNAQTSYGMSRQQAAMQIMASIYSNPDMTGEEQRIAAGRAMDIIRTEFGEDFQLPTGPGGEYNVPEYGTYAQGTDPNAPPPEVVDPTDPTQPWNPTDPYLPVDPVIGPESSNQVQVAPQTMTHGGTSTTATANPQTANVNAAVGQTFNSRVNAQAASVTAALPALL